MSYYIRLVIEHPGYGNERIAPLLSFYRHGFDAAWQRIRYSAKPVRDGVMYWGCDEETGLARFYFHNPRDQRGYGGVVYTLKMKDGTERKIVGPWSSGCGSMNQHFPHTIDCSVQIAGEEIGYASAVLVDVLRPKLEKMTFGLWSLETARGSAQGPFSTEADDTQNAVIGGGVGLVYQVVKTRLATGQGDGGIQVRVQPPAIPPRRTPVLDTKEGA